jgi:hypothetical protein
MAYDLLLRRQVPRDYSRGDETRPPAARAAALLTIAAGAVLLLPHLVRRAEVARVRREYDDGLDVTSKIPAVSMRDLVYESRKKSSPEKSA